MYDKEFWKRTDVRRIFEFIRTGGELTSVDAEDSTAEDRHRYYTTSLFHGMRLARDRIVAFDWNSLGDDEAKKSIRTEEMFDELVSASCMLSDLAFEMGFLSGAKVFNEMNHKAPGKM